MESPGPIQVTILNPPPPEPLACRPVAGAGDDISVRLVQVLRPQRMAERPSGRTDPARERTTDLLPKEDELREEFCQSLRLRGATILETEGP
jgi:hypothetical protein